MTPNEQYLSLKRRLFDKYYSHLNDEQRRAVFTTEGNLLILAGAGSGKTTVLVNRIGFIIKYGNAYHSDYVPADLDDAAIRSLEAALTLPHEQLGRVLEQFACCPCPPWNVLAITFTKKAAEEIRARLRTSLGESVNVGDIWAGTFHSVCVRIIRKYSAFIGYPSDFSIYDTDNTKSLLKEVLSDMGIDEKTMPIKTLRAEISRAKNSLATPEMYRAQHGVDFRRSRIADIYARYQAKLTACHALDFDDIIMQAVKILSECSEAREYYSGKFKYVSVDEFQDTNEAQLVLTRLLGSTHGNIMVVGDDDQSIYRFRGAVVENIISFGKQRGTALVRLERNYRSTECILNAANAVISQNQTRMGKQLYTERADSSLITLHRADTQRSEAAYICDKIGELVGSGKYRYRDIAVLYRLNAISNSIEQSMSGAGIPHVTLSGQSFFDRMEIKDVLAYLHLCANHSDRERLKRIINVPRRTIGAKTLEAVLAIAEENATDPIDVCRHADRYVALSRSSSRLADFAKMIDSLTSLLDTDIALEDFTNRVLELSGYRQMLIDAGEEERERLDNIDELISSINEFEQEYRAGAAAYDPSTDPFTALTEQRRAAELLGAFLERCALVADVDKYDESTDAVVLMTMHAAKGLEFPVVFLPAMEDGVFPGMQNINSPNTEDMEEERRLAYVALTRAKDRIFLTHTTNRMLYNQTSYNPLSRFVREIPKRLIDEDSEQLDSFAYTPRSAQRVYFSEREGGISPSPRGSGYVKGSGAAKAAEQSPRRAAPQQMLKEGDRVRHRVFGDGEIFSAKPMGADVLYEVIFDDAGTKKLMGSFARLTKL